MSSGRQMYKMILLKNWNKIYKIRIIYLIFLLKILISQIAKYQFSKNKSIL